MVNICIFAFFIIYLHKKIYNMTATQVFIMFLKKCCTLDEYLFFRNTIMFDNGNKFFKKRRLYKNTFVEDYLSRNNRTLSNFMTRMFILAPNLANKSYNNPRYLMIRDSWCNEHEGKKYQKKKNFNGRTYSIKAVVRWRGGNGMYVNYYKRKWNQFLREYIESDKSFRSPFKKGEEYEFKLKKKVWEE